MCGNSTNWIALTGNVIVGEKLDTHVFLNMSEAISLTIGTINEAYFYLMLSRKWKISFILIQMMHLSTLEYNTCYAVRVINS